MPQEAQFGIIWSQTRPQGFNPFFKFGEALALTGHVMFVV